MSPSPAVDRPPRFRILAACSVIGILALGACDTGDGTTLRDPTAPTTLPPPDTAPIPTEAIDASTAAPSSFDTLPGSSGADPAGSGEFEVVEAETIDLDLVTPWGDGDEIELRYTCDGSNGAPAISWSGIPDGTQELAVVMVDESDISQGRPFIHWVMAGIAPDIDALEENEVPPGAVQAINFFGDVGYTGPCPNPGSTSTYTVTVVAVGQQLEVAEETPAAQVLDLIETVSIGSASNAGTVTR
ncbi:YbhB/YbcL family Raf kinase inhibitor-like protein [Ilumatobacter sp.]|uniref:YbhB/YbcL family Raf kinase inhibitor-like protein n=1 Tax=Ilumatobacter sp. TaxID=1967498 RepID=UPI003C560AD4